MTETAVRRAGPVAAVGFTATAVVGVVAALAYSGAADAGLLADPGALARWGAPIASTVADLALAVTLGALVLAAFVLPRAGGRTPADGRAARAAPTLAAVAAGVWTVAATVHLVLTYATVTGTPPTSSAFGAELALFVSQIALGRVLLAIVVTAALTCVAALLVTGPLGALAVAAGPVLALILAAQTGHAAGTADHHLAISTMFLHLVAVAVWLGGLATLVILGSRLGADLPDAVARYSAVATWCFAGVAVSGVVNSMIRLGGPEGLETRYGSLVVVKAVLTLVLGGFGWLHRRHVVGRAAVERPRRVFTRLALGELAVMGAVSGVAVALGATAPPDDGLPLGEPTPAQIVTGNLLPPEPTFVRWLTLFQWDVLLALAALAGLVVYLRWVVRLRRRGDGWPVGRTISWVAAMVLFTWATSGGAAVYGHVLFSAHMLQHMVMVMMVPIFLALSAPVTLALRALPSRRDASRGPREWLLGLVNSRLAGFFANPLVAAVNFAGSMIVFYFTPVFELALTTYVGHLAMVVHFSLAGYLFINGLIGIDPGPRRASYPLRLVLLFATMAFHAFFGLALVSGTSLLVPEWFGLMGRPWGLPALEDQQLGGGYAWGVSELPMLAIAIVVAVAWTRDDERTARRLDRAAERDGDADLEAYNAMLGRLAEEPTDR